MADDLKLTRKYTDEFSDRKIGDTVTISLSQLSRWRRPSENAAERLTSTAYRITQVQLAHDKAHGT